MGYILRLAMLLCTHTSYEDQVSEMWLLINPTLDDSVSAEALCALVETLADIAVVKSKRRIEALLQTDSVK